MPEEIYRDGWKHIDLPNDETGIRWRTTNGDLVLDWTLRDLMTYVEMDGNEIARIPSDIGKGERVNVLEVHKLAIRKKS